MAGRRTVAAWFGLSGGLTALAVWYPGSTEGEIYADPAWQRNSDQRMRRIAESRADDATGAEGITWLWQPENEIDAIAGHVSIPRLSRIIPAR